MKKMNRISWLCAALAGSVLFSCTQRELEVPVNAGCTLPAEVLVSIEEPETPATKTHIEGSKVYWDDQDEFALGLMSTNYGRYRYSAASGKAELIETVGDPTNFNLDHGVAAYPYSAVKKINDDGSFKMTLPGNQTYVPGTFDPAAAFMVSAFAPDAEKVCFKNAFGILVVKLYGSGVKVSELGLIAYNSAILNGDILLGMEIGGEPVITYTSAGGGNDITMHCTSPVSLGSSASNSTEFYFMVPPGTYALGLWVDTADGGSYSKMGSSPVTIERNHITRMAALEVVPVGGGVVEPEAVDLGLSVPWATFNVGASAPEELGDLYMWAETEPRTTGFSKENWNYYDGASFTKYCLWPEDGTVDHRIALDPADDVATVRYGSEWRTPTVDEIIELRDNCTFAESYENGIKGTLVTGPSGKTIFLPAVGFNETISPDAWSYLRSSSAYITSRPSFGLFAYCFGFAKDQAMCAAYSAFNGFSVRAVHAPLVSVSGVSISESPFELLVNSSKTLTVTVQPSNATDKRVTWQSTNPSVASVSVDGVVTALSAGGTVIRAWSADGKKTASVRVTVKNYEVPEAVDMGVSVKWANVNLGAHSDGLYESGQYYAWGEIKPKESYTWNNYLWGSSSSDLTKYYSGDGQNQLDVFEDDAARHYLGGVWRIPTKAEWSELLNACNIEAYQAPNASSLPGIKLTSKKNGNCIYLPAAGYMDDGLRQVRKYSMYQSASLTNTDSQFYGPKIMYSSPSAVVNALTRSNGYPIRPVLPDKVNVTGFYIQSPPAVLHVGESQQLCGVVEPENASLPTITWSSSDESIATVDENGILSAVSDGTATITGTTVDGGFSDSFTLTVSYKIPELVDMGLPSGTKWAKYNLGAVAQQGLGKYFAWGETAPKDEYTMESHLYYNGSTCSLFTQDNGFLDSEHDAATVNLGDGWRMPTIDDFDELLNYCTFTTGSYGGIKGYWAINDENPDKRIFFPIAGAMSETQAVYSSYCLLWVSDYSNQQAYSIGLYVKDENININLFAIKWYIGVPIRPVHD